MAEKPMSQEEIAAVLVPETLGVEVRRIWIEWAREQPEPKEAWLVPWDDLSEPHKDVDRRIGTGIAAIVTGQREGDFHAQIAVLQAEIERLKEALRDRDYWLSVR